MMTVMQSATTDPPFVPIRRSGWPNRRSPRLAFAAAVVVALIAVAVGLSHRPTSGERATDLRSLLTALNTGVESCSGGGGDAPAVVNPLQGGTGPGVTAPDNHAPRGAAERSPAQNTH